MEISLARRQRHRRNGGRRPRGGNATRAVAVAIPLFLFGSFLLVGMLGFVGTVGAYAYYAQGLPEPKEALENIKFEQQTVVFDSSGKVELARFGQQKRTVVEYRDLPGILIDATTSIEDKTYWENAGFDPMAILSAAYDTFRGRARGASTITQQLVRARLLPASAFEGSTYERKIKEIIQSIRPTQAYGEGIEGKQKILTVYLNQNFYGNQSYGVAAAAKGYFGVDSLKDLTLAQAAILAAIPQSPTAFDLVKNAVVEEDENGEEVLVVPSDAPIVLRRNAVLEAMKTNRVLTAAGRRGAVTNGQIEAAKKEKVVLARQPTANWRAPHFVWQVRRELGEILCPTEPDNCEQIDTGGYTVYTSLDWNMQKTAEKWVKAAVLAPNQKSTSNYLKALKVPNREWIQGLRGKNIHNGALVAVDYRTGKVLAYVGSASYYAPKKTRQFQPQFDVLADGWRQPGSAFKPINYITGFEDRTMTAATMFMDVTTDFGGGYVPTDADRLERGPIRLRSALQFSLNIPAVKAALISTPDHVFDMAKRFGIEFQSKTNQAGGSIALGTLEVHPVDLTSAYGAIANGGVLMPRTTIARILDREGKQYYPAKNAKNPGTKVVSPQAAYLMTDILLGNTNPDVNPYWGKFSVEIDGKRVQAALKTGTTNDTKDLSAYGFVAPSKEKDGPAIAIGVWMGNSDNSRTKGVFSLESTAPLFESFLEDALRNEKIGTFERPEGIVEAEVDAFSVLRPGPFSSKTVTEMFIDGTVPSKVDDTKIGMEIDQATGGRWAEGCAGPMVTVGVLDLSHVEAGFPGWQKYNEDWINRARRGAGVRGGPAKGEKSRTSYFYDFGYAPYGRTWGAQFAPGRVCEPPPPSPTPGVIVCEPGGVVLNPDGTVAVDQNGYPIPCPVEPPADPNQPPADPNATVDPNAQPPPEESPDSDG
jgi:membrane peptidoglycan carboxypeptidase